MLKNKKNHLIENVDNKLPFKLFSKKQKLDDKNKFNTSLEIVLPLNSFTKKMFAQIIQLT
jgi:hypothetical protein